jgi:hypothetical protein
LVDKEHTTPYTRGAYACRYAIPLDKHGGKYRSHGAEMHWAWKRFPEDAMQRLNTV